MSRADVVIVGGGVAGLAVAAELAPRCKDLFVLEALPRMGMGTSTRNSGVIHSGLYYPTGSLKARHCVEGNRLLYRYCAEHAVPHRRTGKIVVATEPSETAHIETLAAQGARNGLEGLEILSEATVGRLEPDIRALAALRIPTTGLVEPEALVRALAAQAATLGAHLIPNARIRGIEPAADGLRIAAENVGDLTTRVLVNAAGLYADDIARLCGSDRFRIFPCRGEYWHITGRNRERINGLVYPLPAAHSHSLGVHLTRTLNGDLLAGPNARYVRSKEDYESGWEAPEIFCTAIRKLLPEVNPQDLRRAYSGLRPKLHGPDDDGFSDFLVESDVSVPSVIHLAGIESPGLTAALSLARQVEVMAAEMLA